MEIRQQQHSEQQRLRMNEWVQYLGFDVKMVVIRLSRTVCKARRLYDPTLAPVSLTDLDVAGEPLDLVEVDPNVLVHPQIAGLDDLDPGAEVVGAPPTLGLLVGENRVVAHPRPHDVTTVIVDPLRGLARRLAHLEPPVVELEVGVGLLQRADALSAENRTLAPRRDGITQLGLELDVVHAQW